ncbi:MAG: hypothetical protein P4K80_05855 [Acidobacteriaceae bacterium]|nr:hypothetical protein [Acidobacteriaceae bacterium]
MNASFEHQTNIPFESELNDSAHFARTAQYGINTAACAGVVNRTHRVVRERARQMQARHSRARGLMVPLLVCSLMLLLTCFAIWSGLYQYSNTETTSIDAVASTANDIGNQLAAILLWFVPVSITLLAIVLYRRTHGRANSEVL